MLLVYLEMLFLLVVENNSYFFPAHMTSLIIKNCVFNHKFYLPPNVRNTEHLWFCIKLLNKRKTLKIQINKCM